MYIASRSFFAPQHHTGVFHNISAVMDCISCQKCKLHGKLQLLGIGTALKILLVPLPLALTLRCNLTPPLSLTP